jgi:hypothetical protein
MTGEDDEQGNEDDAPTMKKKISDKNNIKHAKGS